MYAVVALSEEIFFGEKLTVKIYFILHLLEVQLFECTELIVEVDSIGIKLHIVGRNSA